MVPFGEDARGAISKVIVIFGGNDHLISLGARCHQMSMEYGMFSDGRKYSSHFSYLVYFVTALFSDIDNYDTKLIKCGEFYIYQLRYQLRYLLRAILHLSQVMIAHLLLLSLNTIHSLVFLGYDSSVFWSLFGFF